MIAIMLVKSIVNKSNREPKIELQIKNPINNQICIQK